MAPGSKQLSSAILLLSAFFAILLCTVVIRHEDVGSQRDRGAVSLVHQDLVVTPRNAIVALSEKTPTIVCSVDKDSSTRSQCQDTNCLAVNSRSR